MNAKSKQRFNSANKRKAMKRGQYAIIVPGAGINPLAFVDATAGLIRVTPEGLCLYSSR